jgi:hypothetical protein
MNTNTNKKKWVIVKKNGECTKTPKREAFAQKKESTIGFFETLKSLKKKSLKMKSLKKKSLKMKSLKKENFPIPFYFLIFFCLICGLNLFLLLQKRSLKKKKRNTEDYSLYECSKNLFFDSVLTV